MAESRDPVSLSLSVQRRGLEQAHRMARTSVDVQRRWMQAISRSLDEQGAFERDAMAVVDRTWRLWLLAATTSVPDADSEFAELEADLDEVLSTWEEVRDEARPVLTGLFRDWITFYDDGAKRYANLLDASFDATMAVNEYLVEAVRRSEETDAIGVDLEVGET